MADDTVTFPRSFRTSAVLPIVLCAIGVLGLLGTWSVAHKYPPVQAMAPALPTLLSFAALAFVVSFGVRVDDTGITQRSLLGVKKADWDIITRLDRMQRSYSVHDRDGKDLILLSLLPETHQKAIADEVIRRCDLRPARQKPERPVSERWI